ncbi:hypothetical protein M0R45_009386 [Rubus argutus]|uniref:Endonuclease/exonuclease/phosphatase domain-containing protein n=1 Tax=Rubus argutus TaxID=59490 RepID=A0AAW1Y401_RUBAR
MKIISWNVRVGRRSKRRLIKEKLVNSKADVVILQETKKDKIQRKLIGSIWGVRYTDWVSIPSNGSSGGILVMWKTKLVLVMEAVIGNFSVSIRFKQLMGWIGGCLEFMALIKLEREEFLEELAGLYGDGVLVVTSMW